MMVSNFELAASNFAEKKGFTVDGAGEAEVEDFQNRVFEALRRFGPNTVSKS